MQRAHFVAGQVGSPLLRWAVASCPAVGWPQVMGSGIALGFTSGFSETLLDCQDSSPSQVIP